MEEEQRDRNLHCAIITQAINDACDSEFKDHVFTAFHYLLTKRSDEHLTLLDIDPVAFREGLLNGMNVNTFGVSVQIMAQNKSKRLFRSNYEIYKKIMSDPVSYKNKLVLRTTQKDRGYLTKAEHEAFIKYLEEVINESI